MKKEKLVHVGTFGQPQGLNGEIKVNIFTSSLESFKALKNFFVDDKKLSLVLEKIKKVGNKVIVSVEQHKDRDAALSLKGKKIFVLRDSFPQTKNNEYYIVDLIDCTVLDNENNILGSVADIKNFGAGDLLEVESMNKKNFYIPMNVENLVNVDLKKKTIITNPIKGILE